MNMLMPILAVFLTCASAADKAKTPSVSTNTVQTVFPNPPDRPRVKWVRAIRNMADLRGKKAGFLQKFFAFMAGGEVDQEFFVGVYGVYKQGGKLYVTDTAAQRLTVVNLEKPGISFVGEGEEGLRSPVGVAVDDAGTIFVADTGDHSVKAFSPGGALLWKTDDMGVLGGKFNRPSGLALTPDGHLLVTDTSNRRIVKLSKAGKFVEALCVHARKDLMALPNPSQIWVHSDGSFAVTDPLASRVHVFSSTGGVIGGFGEAGDSPGYLARPRGVAMDAEGHVHVVDGVFSRVQIFDAQGELMLWYATPGGHEAQLALPAGIFIDKDGMIYIADAKNKRIQVFQYLTYPDEKAAAPAASSTTAPSQP